MTRRLLLLSLCLSLAACDSSDTAPLPLNLYECDAGEAALRHLITTLPDLNPGIPKSYSIVLGEINRDGMTPATDAFTSRFADLKLKFINAQHLKDIAPDHTIADADTRLAAFVLQLRKLQPTSATTWDVEAGWSYKKEFARMKMQLEVKDGKTTVVNAEKLESSSSAIN
ncbi:hypothetical protein [Prosthecobacter sp.]|uniref:hypothetical protein n=1 Tax=Prosthecobacter sp. TaxID=1965333 RepID=UPI002486E5A1|nr:hypothetical protein [Prosthecobacter sp.]MDI1310939.1 hypothetical protein [Prosthecobacter sp.]